MLCRPRQVDKWLPADFVKVRYNNIYCGVQRACFLRVAFGILLVFATYLDQSAAMSAEWTAEPAMRFELQYHDNPRLTNQRHNGEMSAVASPNLKMGVKTPQSALKGDARLNIVRYSEEHDFDSNDLYLDMTSQHKTQRSLWALDAAYDYNTTVTSEFEETGLVQESIRRKFTEIVPSWQSTITEKTILALNYAHTAVDYVDGSSVGLFDYDNQVVSMNIAHQYSQRTKVTATIMASHYDSPGSGAEFDNAAITLGAEWSVAENLQAGLSVGRRDTKSSIRDQIDDEDNGLVLSGSFNRASPLTIWTGSLTRTITPSGLGYAVLNDHLLLSFNKKMTQMLRFVVKADAYRYKSLREEISGIDRLYSQFETGLNWRLTRDWSITASYRYRQQKYDQQDGSAKDNMVRASVNYAWQKRTLSR